MPFLGDFCEDSFWDQTLLINGSWPEFTDCFQDTALVWAPCGFLWFLSPFYTWYLASLPIYASRNTYSKIFLAKLNLTIMVTLVSAIEVFHVYTSSSGRDTSKITANVITTITFILALCFTVIERRKRCVTSGFLFLFWIFQLICNIIPFYTLIELQVYKDSIFSFSIFYIKFAFILAVFTTHCFADAPVRSVFASNKLCPESESSFLSRTIFSWHTKLIVYGYKNPLTEDAMPDLNVRDKSGTIVPTFLAVWSKAVWNDRISRRYESFEQSTESSPLLPVNANVSLYTAGANDESSQRNTKKKKKGPSLIRALCKTFGLKVLHSQVWKLLYDLLLLTNPLILGQLVAFIKDSSQSAWKGYVIALALFASSTLQSFFFQRMCHYAAIVGLQIRASLISTIFRKSLTVGNGALKESTTGEVVNLMSVDVDNIQGLMTFFFAIWSSPFQIGVSLYFLYNQVGLAMLSGAASLFVLVPLNAIITAKMGKLQDKLLAFKDERMKIMNELLSGMKIIKLFAWEKSFEKKACGIRDKELQILSKFAILDSILGFSWSVAPFMVTLLTFLTYVYINDDHYLDPAVAFVAIALFDVVKFAINFAPYIITEGTKAVISARRIQRYLYHDDLDSQSVTRKTSGDGDPIVINNGTFRWSSEKQLITLRNINVSIPEASLVAVVGSVGSGKSSLLSAMLGEIDKVEGQVTVRGSISYVPQQAWIQNDTLRNNILFGKEYDADLYNKCIEACALDPDLKVLPDGDQTEIGEKGINLSGGQKQRVSLARAVYNQADVYLMDDPLSAVDSHVGKHIFNNIMSDTGMLAGKVRVLVTHGLHWLPHTDLVIVITNGQVSESGHYQKLLSHKGDFAKLVSALLTQEIEDDTNTNNKDDEEYQELKRIMLRTLSETGDVDDGKDGGSDTGGALEALRQLSMTLEKSHDTKHKDDDNKKKESVMKADGGLIEEEAVNTGNVKWSVVKAYGRAVGYAYLWVFVALNILYIVMEMGANLWLAQWTDDKTLANFTEMPVQDSERMDRNDYFITIYGIFGIGKTIGAIGSALVGNIRAVQAARVLHNNMLTRILHAPMSFFDTTPIGRIVNRFSKDLFDIDEELHMTIRSWMDTSLIVLSAMVVISYSSPIFIACILPLGILYFFFQRFFIATTRQLKRLSSKTKSPIYNHFNETLTGAPVIRAFGAQNRFVKESERKVDNYQIFDFYSYCSNRWLGIRLELLGNLIILISASIAVLTRDSVSPGIVGLMIVYAIQITSELNWMVRMASQLETQIVSVERIKEYSEVDIEAPWDVADVHRPLEWPQEGVIEFDHLSLRYRPGLDLVLKDLSFTVKGGEKVGIVGRTGAGKSSLTLALFRLIEPAGGKIIVDGVDITMLGLHDLRSKITILPQDPIIFSGTLRQNLDPFDDYDTEAIWTAVKHCHLATFVEGLPDKLDHECGEGGENLSYGQRQLLCLGRALLRKSKILILDEATAAVDMETDELLQKTIREEFKECTVLTIAHRLNTVMDYHRILVLDKGEVNDLDSPENLLKKTDGLFYSMAKAANLVM